ncbi:MAG: hypothetical protein Q4A58_03690 [Fusobacterium sp.]|uniref:hypothetical protein n=1 Tax=Fusobacterium sp. TaxID=68766 RepID=UPI0026DCA526|nr:hypothetical protein [Fusobacterium sp.]MDO4690379.1 hypothetical protein [Fusobacterium sp.]
MKKLIITCPKCTKKIKISNKMAKYKCPYCSNIYMFDILKFVHINIENFFTTTVNKITTKFNNFKNTYKYMKQLKRHMKSDPNWSNYRKQKEEEKAQQSHKSFFSKFKR